MEIWYFDQQNNKDIKLYKTILKKYKLYIICFRLRIKIRVSFGGFIALNLLVL